MREAALITGSAVRIGKEIALALADLGFDIALHYHRSKTEAIRTKEQIRNSGVDCEIFSCDLADEKDVLKLIPRVKQKFPSLALLVNNASIFSKSRFGKSSLKTFISHFEANFKAPYILSCQFADVCKKGHILNMLDANITQTKTAYADYLLFKKALANFTEMAAVQFAPGIRVNGIGPGPILSPPGERGNRLQRVARTLPLKRAGNPNQIVQAVQFLTEHSYVTGQIIFVDGGQHLT